MDCSIYTVVYLFTIIGDKNKDVPAAYSLKSMWWMLFHIHLLGELIAVHIDVDDVLALAVTGAVEGELAGAGGIGLIGMAVDVSQTVGYEGCHPDIMVGVVVDCHHVVAVRL